MTYPTLDDRSDGEVPARGAGHSPDQARQTVGGWMTTAVKTIHPNTALPEAYHLMRTYAIRRLPVVDDQQLVGIVTLGDVREARPSSGLAPSLYELSYWLAGATVSQVMTHQPSTVTPQTSLREAANLMRVHKIGGLPVLDAGRNLVGIVTESDLFRVFMAHWDAELPAVAPPPRQEPSNE